jgi:hypothetical protein
MSKTVEQWLLFEYVGLEHAIIQAIRDEGTGGEGARKIPGTSAQINWGWSDSNKAVDCQT